MGLEQLIQLIISNGMGVGVAIYFLAKDWKQSEQRIKADEARVQADMAQTEVLRELTNTVTTLKDLIMRFHKDDI